MTREVQDLSDTLEVLLQQESVYYMNSSSSSSSSYSKSNKVPVNSSTNIIINKMVSCLENIAELCQLRHRDTLIIATNYLTRYLEGNPSFSSHSSSSIALICLYMACKIHEPAALPMRTLSDLHQRFFHPPKDDDTISWEQLELNVCSALCWRLHPPTAMAFVDQFLEGAAVDNRQGRRLRKRAQACLEVAFKVNPYGFSCEHRASSLAMAALIMAQQRGDTSHFSSSVTSSSSGTELPVQQAMAFLKENRKVNSPPTPSCSSSCTKKNSRKRCVTPPPPPSAEETTTPRSFKKLRRATSSNLSPCLISTTKTGIWQLQQQKPTPCLLWTTRSPRSAFSMAQE